MKPPRPRLRPRSFGFDAATDRLLRLKAKAHGVSQAAFVRAAVSGQRPGAEPGSIAAAADTWWDSRTPTRRAAIFRNHASVPANNDSPDDQLAFFDAKDPEC